MLKQTIDALGKQEGVHDWLARHVHKTSTQFYVIGSNPESRRAVQSERVEVTVMNDHPTAQGGQGRGEASVTILPGDTKADHMVQKLRQAIFTASLSDNPPYGLPSPAPCPTVETADPAMQNQPQEVAARLIEQLATTLATEEGVRLSSAEVFVEESQMELRNSRGVAGQQARTALTFDWVLLASQGGEEMESHIAFERGRAVDLDVPALARRYAQYARDAITARAPQTGTFPVVIGDEALVELLAESYYSPLVVRSAAQFKYQQMTPWEVGKSIFATPATGDALHVYSNALLPFGTRSASLDDDGMPGSRLPIIQNGILTRFWATQRYAEYLGVPATGQFGNMEIGSGSIPLTGLLEDDGPLYYIVAFSAMSPDPFTGDFVGEIRLGYEINKGHSRPIRGGSISGNLFDALAAAHFSQETAFQGSYLGPRAVRFAQVTVAGS